MSTPGLVVGLTETLSDVLVGLMGQLVEPSISDDGGACAGTLNALSKIGSGVWVVGLP
jgi:hypothetical protein